jgi:hypothetical protein
LNRRSLLCLALAPGPLCATRAHAAPPRGVQAEVSSLLASIESSGCLFYRNGSGHDARVAAAHVRDKYDYLIARDLIVTTEDFIERAATKSSLSGQPYEIRCGDDAAVPSNQLLRDKLARLRKP